MKAERTAASDEASDLKSLRSAAVRCASLLVEGWRDSNPPTWPAVRTCVVHTFYRAFALAYDIRVGPIDGKLPDIAPKAERKILSTITAQPLERLTPEHFGCVHETLSGYTLLDARVVESDGRRRGGVHFTPRSLTEPIVRKTIEPLLKIVPPERVLELRVCDPSCGAGAFLLELVRQIGALVHSAGMAKDLVAGKRLAAIHCSYGVDICPFAVDACKLALTLECRAHRMPSDWLDDNVKCGDGLVGLKNREQFVHFAWKPSSADVDLLNAGTRQLFGDQYDRAVELSVQLRKERIAALSEIAGQG